MGSEMCIRDRYTELSPPRETTFPYTRQLVPPTPCTFTSTTAATPATLTCTTGLLDHRATSSCWFLGPVRKVEVNDSTQRNGPDNAKRGATKGSPARRLPAGGRIFAAADRNALETEEAARAEV